MAKSLLREALRPECVRTHLGALDKESCIRELVGILRVAGLLRDPAEAERVVLARERLMSTGLEHGIAIPHGKTDTVDRLLVALGLKPEGIDFGCVDGQPARILILTLSPASRSGPHIRFMAEVSGLLRSASLRAAVLAAPTPSEVVRLLTAGEV